MSRQIINGRRLAALDDADKEAVVFSRADLDDLIETCELEHDCYKSQRQREMLADLRKLREAAFGAER